MAKNTGTRLIIGDNDMATGLRPDQAIKNAFRKRLYRLTLAKGWNQSDLAREATNAAERGVAVSRDNVSTYMRASSVPTEPKLKATAKALEVDPTELLPSFIPASDDPRLRDDEPPAFEMRAVAGEHGKVSLRVNRTVSFDTATKIASLLQGDEGTGNDNVPNTKRSR